MNKNMSQSQICIKAYTFVLCLILLAGCTALPYETPIQALAGPGSPIQGADKGTLSSLIIMQAVDISDSKIFLYFLPDSKIDIAVTRVDRRGRGWRAVASDQQRVSNRTDTDSGNTRGLKVFSSVLGKSPSYSAVYGFNSVGSLDGERPTLQIVWADGFITCTFGGFGGFLMVREGYQVLNKAELVDAECS